MTPAREPRERREIAAAVAIVVLFFAVRVALLAVREPFFDELFTVWLAGRPFATILPTLLHDSGPPLYYAIARIPDLTALRLLSLVFATVPLVVLLARRSLGDTRFAAGALLAVYPPAALYAADARAYALCGALIAIAILLFDDDRTYAAAGVLVVAAYTQYLAVLAFPALIARGWRGAAALAAACVAFIPGFILASRQPAEATGWMSGASALAPLKSFAFAGDYAAALLAPPPMLIVIASAIVLVIGVSRSFRYAAFFVVPVLGAIVFALGGRNVYFPLRFEAVFAVPLVLWLAASLARWQFAVRSILTAALLAAGLFTIARGAVDHWHRGPDPYLLAAREAVRHAQPGERIVASGYCFLPTAVEAGPAVEAFPPEQGAHPGWRVNPAREEVIRAAGALPQESFIFVAEPWSAEAAAVRELRSGELLFNSERTIVARVHSGS